MGPGGPPELKQSEHPEAGFTGGFALEILSIRKGHPLWEKTICFARNSSWRAGPFLAGKMESDDFLDWYEKRAGKTDENCFFIMTEPDRKEHRGRTVCAPGGHAVKPDVIIIAASESAREAISGIIDEVYGREQRRIAVHVLLTEGRLSYGH